MNVLKTMLQILFIALFAVIGKWLSETFHLPLPGNLIGMFLLLFFLFTGIIKEVHIQKGANLLLQYMALFFVPSGVAILANATLIKGQWLPWLILILVTTIIVMIATGKLVDYLISKGGSNESVDL